MRHATMQAKILLPVWWVKMMKSRFVRERQEALAIALSKFSARQLSDYWPFFLYMYEAMDREQRKFLFAIRDRIVAELGVDMRMYPLPTSYAQFVSNEPPAPSIQQFVNRQRGTVGQYIPGYDDDPLSDFGGSDDSGGNGSSDFDPWGLDYSGQTQTQTKQSQTQTQQGQGSNPWSDPSSWAALINAGVKAGTSIYNAATGQTQPQQPQGQTQWGQGGAVPTYAPTGQPTTPTTPTVTAPTAPTTTPTSGLAWWQWLALLGAGAGVGYGIHKATQ